MPTSTKTVITKAAHAKVEAEKNAAVAQLETLKEKYDGMLKKNDDLEQLFWNKRLEKKLHMSRNIKPNVLILKKKFMSYRKLLLY